MIKTFQTLHSATVLRIFETLGVNSKEILTPIKSDKFKIDNKEQEIWGGSIKINDSSFALFLYSEIESVKYLITKLTNFEDIDFINSFIVICGDITGENFESNVVLVETLHKGFDSVEQKEINKKVVLPLSCTDLCDFLKGFETIRSYIGFLLPIKANNIMINKVIDTGKKIILEEINEEDDI